jgi:hypothetical protein
VQVPAPPHVSLTVAVGIAVVVVEVAVLIVGAVVVVAVAAAEGALVPAVVVRLVVGEVAMLHALMGTGAPLRSRPPTLPLLLRPPMRRLTLQLRQLLRLLMRVSALGRPRPRPPRCPFLVQAWFLRLWNLGSITCT